MAWWLAAKLRRREPGRDGLLERVLAPMLARPIDVRVHEKVEEVGEKRVAVERLSLGKPCPLQGRHALRLQTNVYKPHEGPF